MGKWKRETEKIKKANHRKGKNVTGEGILAFFIHCLWMKSRINREKWLKNEIYFRCHERRSSDCDSHSLFFITANHSTEKEFYLFDFFFWRNESNPPCPKIRNFCPHWWTNRKRNNKKIVSLWLIVVMLINVLNLKMPSNHGEWSCYCVKTETNGKNEKLKKRNWKTCIPLAQSRAMSLLILLESSFFPKCDVNEPYEQYSRMISVLDDVIWKCYKKERKRVKNRCSKKCHNERRAQLSHDWNFFLSLRIEFFLLFFFLFSFFTFFRVNWFLVDLFHCNGFISIFSNKNTSKSVNLMNCQKVNQIKVIRSLSNHFSNFDIANRKMTW